MYRVVNVLGDVDLGGGWSELRSGLRVSPRIECGACLCRDDALEAAAAASADQLASMKREIAELEAQMGKAQRQKSTVFLDVASLGPTQQLLVCGESVHASTVSLCLKFPYFRSGGAVTSQSTGRVCVRE
jgi:hypothetical protein